MRLITTQEICDGVAGRWEVQYRHGDYWGKSAPSFSSRQGLATQRSREASFEAIQAAGGDRAKIDEVVGNGSWTELICDECEADVPALVQMGQNPARESSTANLCPTCLRQALGLLP